MSKFIYEGSNGGYPYELDTKEEDYLDFLQSHHDCCICGDKNLPEELLYRTSFGWMHIDCYNEIAINAAEDGSEIPKLL